MNVLEIGMSVCDYIWRNIWMLFSVSLVWLFAAMHNFLSTRIGFDVVKSFQEKNVFLLPHSIKI